MKHLKLYEAFQQLPKGVEEVDYDEYNEITHAKDTRLPFSREDTQGVEQLGQIFDFNPEPLGQGGLYFMLSPTKTQSKVIGVIGGYFSNRGNEFYLLEIDLGGEDLVRYKSDSLEQLVIEYMTFIGWKPKWTKIK